MDIHRPELKQKRLRRRLWQSAAAGVTLLIVAYLVMSLEPAMPKVESASVWLGTVEFGEFVREVRGPGTLVPREIRWVSAASAGRVERVLVKPGVAVDTDTLLVELSNPELQQQAEEARWAAEAAAADLQSLRAELERQLLDARAAKAAIASDYEIARMQADAERDLAAQGIVSRLQYEQNALRAEQLKLRSELESDRSRELAGSVKAQIEAQQARVEQAQRLAQRRQQQLADLSIRAGISGVLQEVSVEPGQRIELGGNIARVAKPEELIAELRIAETQARDIQLNLPVRIDTRNGIVAGRVMRIDPAVQNGTVQVDVELTEALPAGARPDLSVDGTIEIERLQDVLHVGRPAYGQPNSRVSMFRLTENTIAERVQVELGRASVSRIEVSSGLQRGDQVILSDISQWSDYDRVRMN
ncbi:MAG: efflux RND transporter periplasmic adaptor subunit [Gammaproteobacteria bacterium]|jgi:HlyD family secretion protein|nr:efflux RND transporter periplasmic adaptor subunit [Gammaproteobacteria bacterium]